MATIAKTARDLEAGRLIEVYELDLTPNARGYLRFHNSTQQGANNITYGGNVYTPYPIQAEGFEWNTRGVLPRPKMTVSNVGSLISAEMRYNDDFIGLALTRRRTFESLLGTSPLEEFVPDVYIIERKVQENKLVCSFELATRFDAEGVQLPRRQIVATACQWIYRGTDCGYAGNAKAEFNDDLITVGTVAGLWSSGTTYALNTQVYTLTNGYRTYYVSRVAGNNAKPTDTTKWKTDRCGKRLSSCRIRFGVDGALPTSAFPGCNKIPSY